MHKVNLLPKLLLSVLILVSNISIEAQNRYQKKLSTKSVRLSEAFKEYSITELDLNQHKADTRYNEHLRLTIDQDNEVDLVLHPSSILSSNHKISFPNSSDELVEQRDLAIPYSGYLKGDPSSSVRVTIKGNYLYGYIYHNKRKYYIEPAQKFDKSLGNNQLVIYTEADIRKDHPIECAATLSHREKEKTRATLKSSGTCQITDLAIAVDYGYRQDHGGTTGAINQTISVMNMVAGSYEDAFADDIKFEIVEHFISNCSSCNPWTSSTTASTLLSDFSNWGPTGFTQTHDLGQLWTNRNICGDNGNCSVAGLAWINAVCSNFRYHILEDFTSTAWQLRVLVAHEMGHNFGANHDSSSSQDIMAPSITTNTTSWSSGSISEINTALGGFTCFEDCVVGSCSEILEALVNNCTPGSQSTYDLTLEIRHGGGGASTGFDVVVNGATHNFAWSTSPQTVTIFGLIADGTESNVVDLAANDGSDTGCAGTATYDEPSGDCALTIEESFDDCAKPAGWNIATTNIYTWNGGDPLVQYQWKFDDASRQLSNYGTSSNAASLKTIDGTCMAIMDDDIINHNLYTGDVTLTSPSYDVSDFDQLQLQFDYNFHPFEDGGKGVNNSSFKVEVYNGSNWVNVLTDTDSSCPWNNVWPNTCASAEDLDVSNYINDAFAVRYIFSDGNDGKWTGMAALDNIKILGTVESTSTPTCDDGIQNGSETGIDCGGPVCPACPPICEPVVTVTQGESGMGPIVARDLIQTLGTIIIDQATVFDANEVILNPVFEVASGAELLINNEGCED